MTANVMMQVCVDGGAGAFWYFRRWLTAHKIWEQLLLFLPNFTTLLVHCRARREVTADQRRLENGARQESIWPVLTNIYPVVVEDPKFLS